MLSALLQFLGITKSKGVKRGLGFLLLFLAQKYPEYSELFTMIGTALYGVGQAQASGILPEAK